jgi:two-component system, OmpR family, sensor histidine kinase KdpD
VLKRSAARYGLAVVSVLVSMLMALPLYPFVEEFPSLLLLASVTISASFGGFGPALLATAGGFLILDFFFETPPFLFQVSDVGTSLDLLTFLLVALLVATLNARLRLARMRASAAQKQAETALHIRDEALAIVSHDLRTPLTAIKTSVSTLRNPGAPLTDTTRLDLLGTIEAEADRLVHFVSDALAMTRLEAGIAPDRQWNALGEIASAVLDRFSLVLGDRPVTFDVPDRLPLARFDAGLLDQALSNLLENVAVHTPPGTRLSISGRVDADGVRLEVSDSGPGIPLAARERVFGKFQRLADSGFGTGLGLAIARAATAAQGGQLHVEDSPLGGARFILVIPSAIAANDGESDDAR